MDDRLLAAELLGGSGHWIEAGEVMDALRPFLEERRRWRIRSRVHRLAALATWVALQEGGCPAAERAWTEEKGWADSLGFEAQDLRAGMIAMDAAALQCPQIGP